jgi:hypothetical protein
MLSVAAFGTHGYTKTPEGGVKLRSLPCQLVSCYIDFFYLSPLLLFYGSKISEVPKESKILPKKFEKL